jgi:hypothetical protein
MRRLCQLIACLMATSIAAASLADLVPSSRAELVQFGGNTVGIERPASAPVKARRGDTGPRTFYASPSKITPVLYRGGEMQRVMAVTAVYWVPGGFAFPEGFIEQFDRFIQNAATTASGPETLFSVGRQYIDSEGSAMEAVSDAGPFFDATPYPPSGCPLTASTVICLTSAELEDQLSALIASDRLEAGLTHTYLLLLPAGVRVCGDASGASCTESGAETGFCGYHSILLGRGFAPTTYSVIPYHGAGCVTGLATPHGEVLEATASTATHELFETATDPLPGTGYTDSAGYEVADKCSWDFGQVNENEFGELWNQSFNGAEYLLQRMWSDFSSGCQQRLGSYPRVAVTPAFPTVPPLKPFALAANLEADTAPAVGYSWQTFAGFGVTTFASGPTATMSPEEPGVHTVWVAVQDASGSLVTGATRVTVLPYPSANFAWYEAAAGQPVEFDGSASTSPNGPITSWDWNFGDSSTATGQSLNHTFATAGSYTVTMSVTDSRGATSSNQALVLVQPKPKGGAAGYRRKILVKRRYRHHHWEIRVSGSSFPSGKLVVVFAYKSRRWRLPVRIGAHGTFTTRLVSRYKAHLLRVRRP